MDATAIGLTAPGPSSPTEGDIRTCRTHKRHKRYPSADREVTKHLREASACHDCVLGMEFVAFWCRAGNGKHLHVGHSYDWGYGHGNGN